MARLKLLEVAVSGNQKRQQDFENYLQRLTDQKHLLNQRSDDLASVIAAGGELSDKLARFNQVRDQVELLDGLALKFQDLTESKINLAGELAKERSRIELSLEQSVRELNGLKMQKEKLQKEVDDQDKIRLAYQEYKSMLASEAELLARQEAYAQMTARVSNLDSSIQESRIHLEAELMQKERALGEVEELTGSVKSLEHEGEELEALRADLDRLEIEFDLIEKNGLNIKSQIEASGP